MSKGLTKKQLKELKENLLITKQRLINELSLSSDDMSIDSEERFDEIDQASADQSNDQKLRFRNRSVFYLKKINNALEKIDTQEYGHCEECDVNIRYERLMARPTAELCIDCKEESERDESNSSYGRQSKSLGVVIDLVKSY